MRLLKKAENNMAYLKLGIFGSNGSGKTYTAGIFARELHKKLKLKKPVAFIDTETGSNFEVSRFEKEKIEFFIGRTRSFSDLLEITKESENDCSVLIIDSISHFWKELQSAFMKKNKQTFIQMQQWKILKDQWQKFTDLFINTKLHIIMCGRAGNVYEYQDSDEGKKELITTGTKMRAESDMGYEPSLLLEMEQLRDSGKTGSKNINRCHVIKDRSDTIDGKFVDYPTFDFILPHFEFLNIGGEHKGVDTSRTSEHVFQTNTDNGYVQKNKEQDIFSQELENLLFIKYPGRSDDMKKKRLEICKKVFGETSWTSIISRTAEEINFGIKAIEAEFNKTKERKK